MAKTKKTSVGRRGFLKGAAAIIATAQSAVPQTAIAQNPNAANQDWLSLTQEAGRDPDDRQRLRLARAETAAHIRRTTRREPRLVSIHDRSFHSCALHVR